MTRSILAGGGVPWMALLFGFSATAGSACVAPQKILQDTAVVAQSKPHLSWQPVERANAYRVRMQSRAPEGRVYAAVDTVVKTPSYLPPQPLADQRAKVTVRVAAICGDELSAETVTWFLIDTTAKCRLAEFTPDKKGDAANFAWQPVPDAKSYEVKAHRLLDGQLLASLETRTPEAKMELRESAVVSVRPACAGGLGEAVYRVLAR